MRSMRSWWRAGRFADAGELLIAPTSAKSSSTAAVTGIVSSSATLIPPGVYRVTPAPAPNEMFRQEESNDYKSSTPAHPLLPASRKTDEQGGEPVRRSSRLHARPRLSFLNNEPRRQPSEPTNTRSTTCVVPPVAPAAARPRGPAAACTSTRSCHASTPHSSAPATLRNSRPHGNFRGREAEAPPGAC